jgi:excinuclease ABC subunit C
MKNSKVERLKAVPKKPGVYTFKGPKEKVLYVGKAKDLRGRLRSYFGKAAAADARKSSMMKSVRDFTYIVTDSELEALVLEANLIKQYKPRFNVILRDDKNYPYIKLTINEEWPRLEVVRKIRKDGSLYFGPYVPAGGMREALLFIRRHFNIRPCRYRLDKPTRPCIQYQMGRCPAPCAGYIKREDYLKAVREVRLFLEGGKKELLGELEGRMKRLSGEERFEEAAAVRDRMDSVKKMWQTQKAVSPELKDMDVIGFYKEGGAVSFQVFFIRNGMMIGAKDFYIDNAADMPVKELLHGFIEMFYSKEIIPPPEIVLREMPASAQTLVLWLSGKRGGGVKMTAPKRAKRLELVLMAEKNAEEAFKRKANLREDEALLDLKERLSLEKVPSSIGAFDVSTISGSESVGAFICWHDGGFKKDMYRHLKIKTVSGMDDFAMMTEIVKRTLDDIARDMPDLIVIDGGRGQLEAAIRGIPGSLKGSLDVVAIAKKPDRVFVAGTDVPVNIEDKRPSSLLLKKIRDEAHRFAVGFHRKLRDKRLMESPLEKVPGIGRKRRLSLLRAFKSIDAIKKAAVEELMNAQGMNRKTAEALKEALSG